MQLLHDRFLILVVIITGTVILGMFIFHRQVERKMQSNIALRSAPTTFVQTRVKSSSTVQSLPSGGPFRVVRVLDGDTIVLDNGETVRLIGVDAPEIHHSEIPVQRFGEEAAEFLKQFAGGFECTLEYEPNNIRDQYGRLLAYVFVRDRLANAEMIRQGYAYAYTRFSFRRRAEFIALEHEAREHQYGLWHLSLRDGRIANLVNRYELLNMEGRKKLDEILEELIQKYPFE
ncbi:thermonuclease family protein [Patescibacteria group bacterium]|nr:thermonuclease family protein [Patescibacteria group bacterium]